jgi:hypothetical protein
MSVEDHYILEGHEVKAVDMMTWARWLQTARQDRVVARTTVMEGVDVSTVFLGLDHRFGEDGPPLIFETMVFGGQHDQDMQRYSTWDEAEAGHKRMCEMLKEKAEHNA